MGAIPLASRLGEKYRWDPDRPPDLKPSGAPRPTGGVRAPVVVQGNAPAAASVRDLPIEGDYNPVTEDGKERRDAERRRLEDIMRARHEGVAPVKGAAPLTPASAEQQGSPVTPQQGAPGEREVLRLPVDDGYARVLLSAGVKFDAALVSRLARMMKLAQGRPVTPKKGRPLTPKRGKSSNAKGVSWRKSPKSSTLNRRRK